MSRGMGFVTCPACNHGRTIDMETREMKVCDLCEGWGLVSEYKAEVYREQEIDKLMREANAKRRKRG